ncbi:reverse transcriptase (RNA-dependent DNA polymerase) [Hirsutella rhossiliensis]
MGSIENKTNTTSQANPSTVSLQQLPQVPTHTDQQLSRRDKFLNLRSSAQKKVICAKNKESPAGLPSRARVLPTVDYDRPLATTSQTTSKNVRPLTLSSKIPVIRDARPPISDNSYTKRPIRTPHPLTARAMSPEAQLEEICDQMQALDIQASAFRQINIDLWDNDITHDEKDKIAVTTYVAKFIFIVQSGSDQGYDLLGYFQQHFEEWTEDTWDRAPNEYKRALRKLLRKRGIYTEQEFTEMVFDERTAAFRRQTALLGSNASTNPHPSQPPSPSVTPLAAPHQGLNEPQPIKTLTSPPNAPTPAPTIQDKPAPTSLTIHPTSYRFQNPDLVQPVTNPIPEHLSGPATFGEYMKLPPDNIPNAIVDSDIQQKFMKTWNKDRNYTGEPYDLLDDKLRLFLSNCSHIQVKPSQFHALFPRILDGRAQRFYLDKITWATTFRQAYDIFKQHFDTEVNHVHYHTDWTTITFNSIRAQDASKTPHEVLQTLFDKLQLCQRALGREYGGDLLLRTTLMKACRGVPELQYALFKPADNVEHLLADLRASVETHLALITTSQFPLDFAGSFDHNDPHHQYYLDHTDIQVNDPAADTDKATTVETTGLKAVVTTIIATVTETGRRKGCWSTKHSTDERQKAKDQHITQCHFIGVQLTDIGGYILDYEGHEMSSFDDTEDTWEEHDNSTNDHPEQWQASQMLCQQAFNHLITGEDVYQTDQTVVPASQFIIEDRYSRDRFQGIMIDTAGYSQYIALQREDPSVALDSSTSGQASIKFGNSDAIHSLGTVALNTPLGRITFHVLQTPTPFLLCLADMDRLGIYFNNITDTINCTNHCTNRPTSIPVVRKWGHPWFFLTKDEESISFLTETEIRTLHRRFGHPAVPRLHHLLKQAGHTPRRFKFTLNDDQEFNYEIIVDVMHLGTPQRPVLHVVDSATAFQGARFLPSMSAKDTWETLRTLWIDTYLGPPDTLRHDAGTNFASLEFRNEAKIMGIKCSQVPVETHWSIGKIERYHAPLRRAFNILHAEIGHTTSAETVLQMAVKAINDTAGPDGLVPTLLVFGAYPRVSTDSPPSASTLKRSEAMQKAMKMLRQLSAERRVKDALHARNGPSTTEVLSLPLQSEVRVWREKDGWQGPFKIASIDTHNITIDTVNGPQVFRSTLVQPYLRDDTTLSDPTHDTDPSGIRSDLNEQPAQDPVKTLTDLPARPEPPAPRKRGRPPGSKNKPKDLIMMAQAVDQSFLTQKEEDAQALSLKLRSDGIITSPGDPFEESDNKEITDLVGRGVFQFERYDQMSHGNYRIFRSRMVREVKGINTKPYEKSRLVIQGHNDFEKTTLLTQSPTIQRVSQRLILAIAPGLLQNYGITLSLRDITQAYPQSQTKLSRTILTYLPTELQGKYPNGTIIRVIKPLYGIAEAGVHWFRTYQQHHLEKLDMSTSTYDSCLLISNTGPDTLGIVGMQTDDTLILGTNNFSTREEEELQKAEFRSKPKTDITYGTTVDFNGARLTLLNNNPLKKGSLLLQQKGQAAKMTTIDPKAIDRHQRYVEERARASYIASIAQPEASFDVSVAAQVQTPEDKDYAILNKRLQWQMDHQLRGLTYKPIDLATAKLMVFTDGSFANNKDLSSQLGFVIALVNETNHKEKQFEISGNIVHWSSTKCKRVTRSVLASEIYGMANGFDIGISLAMTMKIITERLNLPPIPLIVCTDSYSLYECLVKLGTTKEKRLMIDIMALRQSYEKREITDIRWINGADNPADAMTKASPNRALERFIDTNSLTIRVEGYVQRS